MKKELPLNANGVHAFLRRHTSKVILLLILLRITALSRLITCIPHSSALRRIMCESRPGWCIAGTQSEEKDTNQPYHLRSCWLILGKEWNDRIEANSFDLRIACAGGASRL